MYADGEFEEAGVFGGEVELAADFKDGTAVADAILVIPWAAVSATDAALLSLMSFEEHEAARRARKR